MPQKSATILSHQLQQKPSITSSQSDDTEMAGNELEPLAASSLQAVFIEQHSVFSQRNSFTRACHASKSSAPFWKAHYSHETWSQWIRAMTFEGHNFHQRGSHFHQVGIIHKLTCNAWINLKASLLAIFPLDSQSIIYPGVSTCLLPTIKSAFFLSPLNFSLSPASIHRGQRSSTQVFFYTGLKEQYSWLNTLLRPWQYSTAYFNWCIWDCQPWFEGKWKRFGLDAVAMQEDWLNVQN